MKKLLAIPAYFWAVLCLVILPVTFIANDKLARHLSELSFMKVHPKFSGGLVAKTHLRDGIQVDVHEPVFPALTGSATKGFVQVTFRAIHMLPPHIHQSIDYNHDGVADFSIRIDTSTGNTELQPMNPLVHGLQLSLAVKDTWVVRINISTQ